MNDLQPAIEAHRLGRRFGRHWALAHVELEVARGEALLLAGPNGSGKTTLLRLIAGLYRPTRGQLEVFGVDPLADRYACRRTLAMVSHDSYLYPRLTALETLRIWARLLGRPSGDSDLRPLLAEVGLDHRRDTPVLGFSAGMRKRLVLLRTRLETPQLVLLDEPFSALDPDGQEQVASWIGDFRRAGITVVLASHSLARAARLCSRALLLDQGQIAWQGPAGEVGDRLGEAIGKAARRSREASPTAGAPQAATREPSQGPRPDLRRSPAQARADARLGPAAGVRIPWRGDPRHGSAVLIKECLRLRVRDVDFARR